MNDHMNHNMNHAGHDAETHQMMQANDDHDQHNMDHHDHMSMMNHMMSMNFHFGTNETVLFSFWTFSTVSGLIGSMIGIFILAALYEGLKYYREYLFWRSYNILQYRSVQIPNDKTSLPTDTKVTQPSMFSIGHGCQTVLHVFQIVISYFLMLIFMTYNVWLALAVVAGSMLGFFLFGWKKSIIVDVTEHCH